MTDAQAIPTIEAALPLEAPPLDLLAATATSPLLPTIAIIAIGWRIITHVDAKIDRLDDKIDNVRRELSDQIQARCPSPRAAVDAPLPRNDG